MRYFQFSVPSWGVGKGNHYPGDEKAAPGEETVGRGEAGFVGRGEKYKKYKYKTMVLIHISLDDVIAWPRGPDLRTGSHCLLSWGRQAPGTGAGSQAN